MKIFIASLVLILGSVAKSEVPRGLVEQPSRWLPPGAMPHSFQFTYNATIAFPAAPVPATVLLTTLSGEAVAEVRVRAGGAFTIQKDLFPGTYFVKCNLDAEASGLMLDAFGPRINLSGDGKLIFTGGICDAIIYAGKISGAAPGGGELVKESRPTFKWTPVTGTAYYEITLMQWFNSAGSESSGDFYKSAKTVKPEYRPEKELKDNRRCAWVLRARAADGHLLAAARCVFYTRGSQPLPNSAGVVSTRPAPVPVPSTKPGSASGYIGVWIHDSTFDTPTGAIAVARVAGVEPGSPASISDLRDGDLITSANGKSFELGVNGAAGGAASLGERIKRMQYGELLTLTVSRNGNPEELTVRIEVE